MYSVKFLVTALDAGIVYINGGKENGVDTAALFR